MGQVHPLQTPPVDDQATLTQPSAGIRSIDSAHCALCGAKLSARALRYHVVSPQYCEASMTVCYTCHKVALSEGYRPAE